MIWGAETGECLHLAKGKKKHEVADTAAASGKISRKEFDKELARLQVEPCGFRPGSRLKKPGSS